jgi:thioesterase domain-containing protein
MATTPGGARTPTETYLARLWAEVLGVAFVDVNDDFFHLGGSSLQLLELFRKIRHDNNIDFPLRTIFECPTVSKMALLIRTARPDQTAGRCLVTLSREGWRSPLFCVHGAGGAIPIYGPLSRALSPIRPSYGLQAVGLTREVAPDLTIKDMACRYLAETNEVWPTGPLLIAGYSMGGLVALEMARAAATAGRDVTCVLLDTRFYTGISRAKAMFFAAQTLGLEPRDLATLGFDRLATDMTVPDEEIQERMISQLTTFAIDRGLLPSDAVREDIERFVDIYAINSAAVNNYTPQPYDGDVIYVGTGTHDYSLDEALHRAGLADVLRGNTSFIRAYGDHNSFLSQHAALLAPKLEQLLKR